MPNPKFDIQIATNSTDTKVFCNGEDISSLIRAIKVEQIPMHRPIVTLELVRSVDVVVHAQCVLRLEELATTSEDPKSTPNGV